MANAEYLTKHDGNGDNRFAILIQGSGGDKADPTDIFEQDQFEYNVQEMARILTEHPRNKKPGPGYTGYYLQDHMYFAQSHDKSTPVVYRHIPEIEKDVEIPNRGRHDTTGKTRILNMIQKVANKCDSYDNVLFFYTSHGRPHDWMPYKDRKFLFDANNQHETALQQPGESANDAKWSTTGDIWIPELDKALDPVICHKMIIILQPCFSGNWIDYNYEPGKIDTYRITLVDEVNEKNRVVMTSEVKSGYDDQPPNDDDDVSKLSILDKCNMGLNDGQVKQVYKVGTGTDDDDPKIDGEEYQGTTPRWRYQVRYQESVSEDLFEIDTVDQYPTFQLKFYENYKDEGAEFVSGLVEAHFMDLFYEDVVVSNGVLDADEDTTNGFNGYPQFPSISGNDNDYVSCKEAYNFMKLFHLGYRLNKNPWIDNPQITYTNLEIDNNYIF